MKSNVYNSNITPLQGFFSRETNFHFCQFKYLSSNMPLSHLYNIFAIYFPDNSPFLKSLSSTISNFSCLLTSAFSLSSNSTTTFFTFSRSFSFFQLSCSAINLFHYTKYFITLHTFLFLLPIL